MFSYSKFIETFVDNNGDVKTTDLTVVNKYMELVGESFKGTYPIMNFF